MQVYGNMPNGDDVFQVTIESNDLKLKVLSLGAIIQDVRMRSVTHSLVPVSYTHLTLPTILRV